MNRAELATSVAATDRHLALDRAIARAGGNPRADRVMVRSLGVGDLDTEPVTERCRRLGCAGTHVPPHLHVLASVHLDEVEQAVEVQIDEGGTAGAGEVQDPGRLCRFAEHPVGSANEQVAGIP
jgi:hypothetical protein